MELSSRLPNGYFTSEAPHKKIYSATQAVRYIDFAVQYGKSFPDGSILKFAVKSIIYHLADSAKTQVLEYILNLVRYYPILLPSIELLMEQ